jgi:hypothetical protein
MVWNNEYKNRTSHNSVEKVWLGMSDYREFKDKVFQNLMVDKYLAFHTQPSSDHIMIYDEISGQYYTDDEYLFDQYYESEEEFPLEVYLTKPVELDGVWAGRLAEMVVDYLGDSVPELSTEDVFFDEMVDLKALADDLKAVIDKHIQTVEPDYTKPVKLEEEFKKWLNEEINV